MPNNYVLLEKIVVGSAGASSVTFANIPQTGYTDLVVKMSARNVTNTETTGAVYFNSDTTNANYSARRLLGDGSSASSANTANPYFFYMNTTGETASTFANCEMYIPNYTGSTQKSVSVESVTENNATAALAVMVAGLWTGTAAINAIQIRPYSGGGGNFAANSTFYLYGVAKLGTTPAIAPKATGGDVIDTDGTYWYHIFRSSGTFTPAVGLSCDALVVAGGGGAANNAGGGGGAGGFRTATGLSLTFNTAYTVTVGAGGAGGGGNNVQINGTKGSNSVFSTITSTGGGYGAVGDTNGGAGGSGGGTRNSVPSGGSGNEGLFSPSEGNNGGKGFDASNSGGGGGASAVGADGPNATTAGNGGAGTSNSYSGSAVTYAGGGGGGAATTDTAGTGGAGGGGNGNNATNGNGSNGTTNLGGGGGGAGPVSSVTASYGGSGGSGIVIVRYLVA